MAAPSGTTWGSTVGSYGRIGLYVNVLSTTSTQLKYEIEVWFWSKYSVTDSNNTLYYDHKSASGSASTSRGGKSISTTVNSGSGWSTSNQKRLATYGTYTIERTTSAQKRYVYAKLTNVDAVGGTMYASRTVTIPALPSYTIKYNANGGSSTPDDQTKYYGKAITLAKAISRTGYTFQGWGTSASDTSVDYKAGASYTTNASDTFYAIWKINTYTVTFNANGGTGGPTSQTKTYGKDLTLVKTEPTRTGYDFLGWSTSNSATTATYKAGETNLYKSDKAITLYAVWKKKTYTITFDPNGGTVNPTSLTKTHDVDLKLTPTPAKPNYNFKGWATSASSITVAYNAGVNYTANANITLYAVWELAYKKPIITNLQVSRCDQNGDPVDDSIEVTSGLVSFTWTTFFEVSSITITWFSGSGDTSQSKTVDGVTGTNGTVSQVFGDNLLPLDQTFSVIITVADSGGSTPKDITLDGYVFTIDMLGGGKGVSFGKPAELENVADFEFEAFFRNGIRPLILSDNTDLNEIKIPNIYAGNAATTAGYLNCPITTGTSFTLEVLPAGGDGQLMQRITSCSKTAPTIYVRHYYSNAWSDDWITI